MFTGDTFGVAYPELTVDGQPFIFPPSSPVDFNPTDWLISIDKLMTTQCERAYLTHFCMVENLKPLATALRHRINVFAKLATESPTSDALSNQIERYFIEEVLATGCSLEAEKILEILTLDMLLIVQGLRVWVEKNTQK